MLQEESSPKAAAKAAKATKALVADPDAGPKATGFGFGGFGLPDFDNPCELSDVTSVWCLR